MGLVAQLRGVLSVEHCLVYSHDTLHISIMPPADIINNLVTIKGWGIPNANFPSVIYPKHSLLTD